MGGTQSMTRDRRRLESGTHRCSPEVRAQRILVVDDEESLRETIAMTLGLDHDVEAVAGPAEALARVTEGHVFDLVLLDLKLGRADGLDLYRELCELAPELRARCVLMTGAPHEARAALTRHPELRQLAKPFFYDDLVDLVLDAA